MRDLIKILLIPLAFALSACSSSVPGCADKNVIKLMRKIASEKLNLQLLSVSAITTTGRTEHGYQCTGHGKFKAFNTQMEFPVDYQINLADNGREFSVDMLVRQF